MIFPLAINLPEVLQEVELRITSSFGTFSVSKQDGLEWHHKTDGVIFRTETVLPTPTVGLNAALLSLQYTVRVYDARPLTDYVQVQLFNGNKSSGELIEECQIPVVIRRRPVPTVFYREGNEVTDRVTIVTKVTSILTVQRTLIIILDF